MLNGLLVYRFLLVNVLGIWGIVLAGMFGLIEPLFQDDFTYLTSITSVLFLTCWVATFKRVLSTSKILNNLKSQEFRLIQHSNVRASKRVGFQEKLWAKVAWLSDVSQWLVGLGLIGTIIGFSFALSGVDESLLGSAQGVSQAIGPLMEGMRVALNTTIVGAILGMWNEVNQRMLKTAISCMLADGGDYLK